METESKVEVPAESGGMAVAGDSGVNVRVVDENWQVSTMPEEKQYFSLDVSFIWMTLVNAKRYQLYFC